MSFKEQAWAALAKVEIGKISLLVDIKGSLNCALASMYSKVLNIRGVIIIFTIFVIC